MKYCSRWSLRARIFDSEATFVALRTISWYMAWRDFLLQVILFPPAALLLANVSRVFGHLAHQNQDFSRLTSSFAISCRHTRDGVSRYPCVKARAPSFSYSESSSGIKVFVMRPQTRENVKKSKIDKDLNIFMKSENWWNLFQMVAPSKDFGFWSYFRCAAHNFLVYGL